MYRPFGGWSPAYKVLTHTISDTYRSGTFLTTFTWLWGGALTQPHCCGWLLWFVIFPQLLKPNETANQTPIIKQVVQKLLRLIAPWLYDLPHTLNCSIADQPLVLLMRSGQATRWLNLSQGINHQSLTAIGSLNQRLIYDHVYRIPKCYQWKWSGWTCTYRVAPRSG